MAKAADDRSKTPVEVILVEEGEAHPVPDLLATESPLEIRLTTAEGLRPVAVTMRTPGSDPELAAGFLYAEGVVEAPEDILHLDPGQGSPPHNELTVVLRPGLEPELSHLDRHFYTSSACGVCGKGSLEALVMTRNPRLPAGPEVSPELLCSLPARLEEAQGLFRLTGGLHAAALFDRRGDLLAAREDVGRHNALDKLLGWAFLEGRLPLHDHLVLVSGRASYELLQKCVMAEVPVVCAVSAPSSLAVSVAREFGTTLVGFLRHRRFNIYAGAGRIVGTQASTQTSRRAGGEES